MSVALDMTWISSAVAEHAPRLLRHAARCLGAARAYTEPADVVDTVLLRFLEGRFTRDAFSEDDARMRIQVAAWLKAAVRLHVQEVQRQIARELRLRRVVPSQLELRMMAQTASRRALACERVCEAFTAMRALSRTDRELLELRDILRLSYEEIASRSGWSGTTMALRQKVARIRVELRMSLPTSTFAAVFGTHAPP